MGKESWVGGVMDLGSWVRSHGLVGVMDRGVMGRGSWVGGHG